MDELARQLSGLRQELVPPWSDARRERVLRGVGRLQRRRRFNIRATASVAALALLVGWRTFDVMQSGSVPPVPHSAPARNAPSNAPESRSADATPVEAVMGSSIAPGEPLPRSLPVRLADGSLATIANADTQLYLTSNQPDRVQLRLAAGTAHFEVVPNERRAFSVVSEAIEVIVVGTAFDVEHTQSRVRVAVSHGRVRVRSFAGDDFVQAGESRWFEQSPITAANLVPNTHTAIGTGESARKRRAPSKERAQAEWRRLNQSGDYERADALLEQGAAVEDDAEALIEAADVARLAGHVDAAVQYLRKVVAHHRSEPATPLAAFTLGRVLLERMGRPSEAAEAFRTARELAQDSSLAHDALAREVEAWSKAGRTEEAYLRARVFVTRYPDSRRRRVVELYGGVD